MQDLWKKIKLFYFGSNKLQQKLFPPILLIIIVYFVVRWASAPQYGIVLPGGLDDGVFKQLDDGEIKTYLDTMTDTRSEQCQSMRYKGLGQDTVSIILDFHDHQFYDLKMTFESLIRHTPDDLYAEIILLDDGTGKEAVRRDAIAYLDQPRFKKVRAFRSESSQGSSLSRFKASRVATGTILAFISSDVAVNNGWLEPLIAAAQKDRNMVAVPHTDSLLSGFRFFKTPDNLINTMDWKLWTLFTETMETGDMLTTPVMTGSAFVVNKAFLEQIGSFDESMDKGGGENLELSLRTWMCGGSIKVVTCSRVAVRNALSQHEIMTARNFRRIVELWFGNHKPYAYRQGNHSYGMDESEKESLQSRRTFLKKQIQCSSFDHYLTTVQKGLVVPPDDARYFGKFKCKTGYCLSTDKIKDTEKIKMVQCRPHIYEPDLLLTLTTRGHIRCPFGDCLTAKSASAVEFGECDDMDRNQKWSMTVDKQLMLSAEADGSVRMCLAHGIEYSTTNTHYLQLNECVSDDRSYQWSFIKY